MKCIICNKNIHGNSNWVASNDKKTSWYCHVKCYVGDASKSNFSEKIKELKEKRVGEQK